MRFHQRLLFLGGITIAVIVAVTIGITASVGWWRLLCHQENDFSPSKLRNSVFGLFFGMGKSLYQRIVFVLVGSCFGGHKGFRYIDWKSRWGRVCLLTCCPLQRSFWLFSSPSGFFLSPYQVKPPFILQVRELRRSISISFQTWGCSTSDMFHRFVLKPWVPKVQQSMIHLYPGQAFGFLACLDCTVLLYAVLWRTAIDLRTCLLSDGRPRRKE
jgi:hypothetical protein